MRRAHGLSLSGFALLLFIAGADVALAMKVSNVIGEDPKGKTYLQVTAKLNPSPAKPRYTNIQRDERATSPDSVGKVLNDPEVPTSGPDPIVLVVGREPTDEERAQLETKPVEPKVSSSVNTPDTSKAASAATAQTIPVASISVPRVVDLRRNEASRRIYRAGLVPVFVDELTTDQTKVGKVIRTSPPANGKVTSGSEVTVFIGKAAPAGAKLVKVGNVDGMGLREAEALLVGQGLRVRLEQKPTDDESKDGQVESQDPPEGTEVAAGSEVTLICYKYESAGAGEMPKVTGMTVRQARQGIAEAAKGFRPRVRLEKDTAANPKDEDRGKVARQQPEPGKELAEGTEVVLWYVPKKGLGPLGPIIGVAFLALAAFILLARAGFFKRKRGSRRAGRDEVQPYVPVVDPPPAQQQSQPPPRVEPEPAPPQPKGKTLPDLWTAVDSMQRYLAGFETRIKGLAKEVEELQAKVTGHPRAIPLSLPAVPVPPPHKDLRGAWDYYDRLAQTMGGINRAISELAQALQEVRAAVSSTSATAARSAAVSAAPPPPSARPVPQEPQDPLSVFNRVLDSGGTSVFKAKFPRARAVRIRQHSGDGMARDKTVEVALEESPRGNFQLVEDAGKMLLFPLSELDEYQLIDTQQCFETLKVGGPESKRGQLKRLVRPAECTKTAEGWVLSVPGKLEVYG